MPRWVSLLHLPAVYCLLLLAPLMIAPLALVAQPQAGDSPQVSPPSLLKGKDSVVELGAFEVRSAPDDSYGALNSNSITSFNTELSKLPMSADILTTAFMEDTNSTTMENMLRDYAAGAGTGSVAGDAAGIPVNQPMDRGGGDSVSAGIQLRGLGAAVVKQDGFMLPSPAGTGLNSNFGVERIEIINGPQALLYGNGGGGGVVNMISKQAHFDRRASGTFKFQINNYGNRLGQLDYQMGGRKFAVAVSLLRQELGDSRDWIGGPLDGYYVQLAARLGRTTLRLTGKQTELERFTQRTLTLNAGSTVADARHGQQIRYLLATNQIEASASGPSGAGVIANGHITWENLDSFSGTLASEVTTARLASLSAETTWSPWLSTYVAAGYQSKKSYLGYGSGFTFFSPNAPANPAPGEWTMAGGAGTRSAWSNQPSYSKSFRFSMLLTNDVFDSRGRSQTIVGVDFTEGNYANVDSAYYQSDSSFNPVLTPNGSRIEMPPGNPFWSVSNGPVRAPFPWAGEKRITYGGVNYVAQVMNQTDPSLVSPQNPQGLTGTNRFVHSRAISRGAYAVNYTQWRGGDLTSLLGLRYVSGENRQLPSTPTPAIEASGENLSFSAGLNYDFNKWIRPYVLISDTYNLPGILLTVPSDPYGNPAPISHSLGQEVGVKIAAPNDQISGSVSFYWLQSEDEPYAIPSQIRDAINPNGINGRGASGTVIPIKRKSYGMQVALTASPKRGWRMRLSAAFIKGTVGTSSSYATLYNDQFYANSSRQVTYADGTVVYVRPTFLATPGTSSDAGYVPLTIEALSTPGDPYYANPNPVNGVLRASNGRTLLLQSHPVHGPIRTGAIGLPISALQVSGVTPMDSIVASRDGDRTTGYPEFGLNYTNLYSVEEGLLKGLRIGGTALLAWRIADYYYYPDGYSPTASRVLFFRPIRAQFNAILGYGRRFGRVTWHTQLNVNNVFDRRRVIIRPNNLTGFSGVNSAIFSAEPRNFTWTTSFNF